MAPLKRRLSRRASKLLNRTVGICWLVPSNVDGDERIIRAIYSPYHVTSDNKLKHQAYDPTPTTDEISTMRLEHMGAPFCRRKAKTFEDPDKRKALAGLAILRVETVISSGMGVVDSRKHYCGHADIRLLIPQLIGHPKGTPLPPVVGKRLKDLKKELLKGSEFFRDPKPDKGNWRNRKFLKQVENHG
jgi:hypothetical protein